MSTSDGQARGGGGPETVLAFDTSAAHCAAALVRGDTVLAHRHEDMTRGQAERLFPLIETVLDDARLSLAEIGALAVGTGPGNFTGLRIAVAAARGLALALGRPALGIPNLEALAFGLPCPVLTALAAPRGQVYVQRFGAAPMGPAMLDPEALGPDWAVPGLSVAGHDSAALAARLGATERAPASPAIAIALTAAGRL
ncbi:MAG: tRNA (adenosine(37)-N6)-threonylcarbamoyltransferase complex dimerization subunit type 1 TsaB, partial [Roseicyclus sp.]